MDRDIYVRIPRLQPACVIEEPVDRGNKDLRMNCTFFLSLISVLLALKPKLASFLRVLGIKAGKADTHAQGREKENKAYQHDVYEKGARPDRRGRSRGGTKASPLGREPRAKQ